MDISEIDYLLKEDLKTYMEAEKLDKDNLSVLLNISRPVLYSVLNNQKVDKEILEKFYSCAYKTHCRFNVIKEQLLKESNDLILFHGSKEGLNRIEVNGSRDICDFGKGFYLGETFNNALSFVCNFKNSSVYSFKLSLKDLKILNFNLDKEWLLAICYFRGWINNYKDKEKIKKIINKINSSDLIIAPIADNRMFYIIRLFVEGEINIETTLHALSASDLGKQYVIKSKKALERLKIIEKYYLCNEEKLDARNRMVERTNDVSSKLKIAKRKYQGNKYIEDLFND